MMYHFGKFFRQCISQYGNHSFASGFYQIECNSIVARNNGKSFGTIVYNLPDLIHFSRCFLDGHDIRAGFRQTQRCFGFHIYSGSSGNVIQNNRSGRNFTQRTIVLEKPFLIGFVVIGSNGKYRRNVGKIRHFEFVNNFGRIVAPDSNHYGKPIIVFFDNKPYHFGALVARQRGSFGGGSQRDKIIDSAINLIIDQSS